MKGYKDKRGIVGRVWKKENYKDRELRRKGTNKTKCCDLEGKTIIMDKFKGNEGSYKFSPYCIF